MELGLAGRTAVVTGASRGIGLAVTRGLAAHGANVVAGARRSSAELDQLAKEGSVRVLEVDLAAQGSVTGRFSRPEEVADLVLLASDRTANVTGADFRIDGGLVATW